MQRKQRDMHRKLRKTALLICCVLASSASAATKTASLAVYKTVKYQPIDGFGGTGMNGQWSDVYTQQKVNMLWGTGQNQMGLNIMRVRVNPNEGNWGEYGNAIKWARQANPDVQVFASPWTPPKKYKTSQPEKYQNEFGTWVWPLVEHSWGGQGSNGGTINDDYIDDYADFLERYRQRMEEKGCPVDMISMQNECDYTPTTTDASGEHASYESCIYSPNQMAKMVKAARRKIDAKCKVMGPETFGWGQKNYNLTLANISDAVDNIDVWGNHLYGSNDWTYINTVKNKTGKHMWMTEYLIDYESSYTGEFSAEYAMIESLENSMKNGYNGYVYYNMLNDFFACNHGGSATELWKRAYVFSHYAKYATGKTRTYSVLSDTSKGLLGGSAYINDEENIVTVFVLNKSANDYTLTVKVPFVPTKIMQIATSDSQNAATMDVTDMYSNGTETLKVSLKPGTFYTFQFSIASGDGNITDSDLGNTYKEINKGNPLNPFTFCADPTAVEYNGRMYVYGTNDQQEFNVSNGQSTNSYGNIKSFVCMSSADLVNWAYHGEIDMKSICPWIYASWAPSIVSREESDGKTHFYLYFTNSASGIGVVTATSPLGPWTDPLGKPLISSSTPGLGTISNLIDPGVVINNDGTAWMTFGGGSVNAEGTNLYPGNARIVKLGTDMISLASDIATIPAPYHFEANELNVFSTEADNQTLFFSYSTNWGTRDDWSDYAGKGSNSAPTTCSMAYMRSSDPLNPDSWIYCGELLKNPGKLGYPYGNNHSHMQKYNNGWYLLYHTQYMEDQMGLSNGYRNIAMSKASYYNNKVYLTSTTLNNTGVAQLTDFAPTAYERQEAEMLANAAGVRYTTDAKALTSIGVGDWTEVRKVKFDSSTPLRFLASIKGKGIIQLRVDQLTGTEPLATFAFDNTELTETCWELSEEIQTKLKGSHDLYFVFSMAENVEFDAWQFLDTSAAVKGDANGDGKIDVADITAIAGYILGSATEAFNTANADVNGDGQIDVADITATAGIILGE